MLSAERAAPRGDFRRAPSFFAAIACPVRSEGAGGLGGVRAASGAVTRLARRGLGGVHASHIAQFAGGERLHAQAVELELQLLHRSSPSTCRFSLVTRRIRSFDCPRDMFT